MSIQNKTQGRRYVDTLINIKSTLTRLREAVKTIKSKTVSGDVSKPKTDEKTLGNHKATLTSPAKGTNSASREYVENSKIYTRKSVKDYTSKLNGLQRFITKLPLRIQSFLLGLGAIFSTDTSVHYLAARYTMAALEESDPIKQQTLKEAALDKIDDLKKYADIRLEEAKRREAAATNTNLRENEVVVVKDNQWTLEKEDIEGEGATRITKTRITKMPRASVSGTGTTGEGIPKQIKGAMRTDITKDTSTDADARPVIRLDLSDGSQSFTNGPLFPTLDLSGDSQPFTNGFQSTRLDLSGGSQSSTPSDPPYTTIDLSA